MAVELGHILEILAIINPKRLKRRKVGQPFWQSFLKALPVETTYRQSLKGSEMLKLVGYTLQFIPSSPYLQSFKGSTQVEVLE